MTLLTTKEKKQIKNLVEVINNDLITSTYKLSVLFELAHTSLVRLVKKHMQEFIDVGESEVKTRPLILDLKSSIRNKKSTEYLLNEPQAMYLILLSKNKEIVRKFKSYLTKEFFRQRKFITKLYAQKQNAEWLEKREAGKIQRREETDAIKTFIEYAEKQGSKNAKKYYLAISKMENKTLFNLDVLELKFPNLRDLLEGYQLSTLQNADRIVARALKEGMDKALLYKEIYVLAKERIEKFVELIGRTPIQNTLVKALA